MAITNNMSIFHVIEVLLPDGIRFDNLSFGDTFYVIRIELEILI